MANPVTYNSGSSIAGSLKSSVISVGISPSLSISGYNWRNGFENNNIWVIYSDTYSQGQSTQGNAVPTIWATPIFTDAGLLNMINVLPARAGQIPFTTLSDAITWLYGENKYFLSNQNYPPIVTDGLSFIVDAGFAASYPNVGTSCYDLSVQQFTNTMQNGLVWTNNNTKSYFDFDGADDQIFINNYNNFNNITWSNGMTVQVLYKIDDLNDFNGQFRAMMGTDSSPRSFNYYLYGPNNPATTLLYHFSANFNSGLSSAVTVQPGRYYLGTFSCGTSSGTYYHNLDVVNSQTGSAPQFYTGVAQYLGRADNFWKGNIGSWKIYNKALSADEITQNYYQGPIVTSNLTYLWDAGNIISYFSGSSSAFDLKGSGINGTLQNGVGYSTNFGGYWNFDGSDDRILLTNSLYSFTINANTNWTVSAWVRTGTSANGLGNGSVMSNSNGGPVFSMLGINNGVMTYWHYNNDWLQSSGTVVVNDNQWHMLTWVNTSNSKMAFYVDGVLDTANADSSLSSNNWIDIIGGSWAANFGGDIGSVQVNKDTAMTAVQVNQQFGATRSRFISYSAYANGGTISTITENGTTYRVHTFTTSGTLSVIKGGSVEVLVVAGGGAGGFQHGGGGGGAGGVIYLTGYELTAGNKTVTIGAGGVGGFELPTNGNNSVFDNLTSIGGGYGGSESVNLNGNNGGSGGGGSGFSSSTNGGSGTTNQGFNGGRGAYPDTSGVYGSGGGGGGAAAPGTDGKEGENVLGSAGNGGNGRAFTITGSTAYFGGGGGGGYWGASLSEYGVGGLGGGGNGGAGSGTNLSPTAGGINTGGGGGGSRGDGSFTRSGASGGSGIVIVRYPIY